MIATGRILSAAFSVFFFFQAEDGIRDGRVTGVQTCALPILDPEARQHPVPPVPHAVRRGPRPVEGEEEDVDRGDENGGTPDGPRAAEEHRVLRREGAAHASAVTWSAARRTGRRPPTPPARRSGAPTASRTPRGPPSSPGRSPAARSSRRAGPS